MLRDVRLRAMKDSPSAFGSTYEREAARTVEDWERWYSPGVALMLEHDHLGPVGLVAGAPDRERPGEVLLMALWVDPRIRGQGGGDLLVETLLEWACGQGASRVRLRVTGNNIPAERLYARHGFLPTGAATIRDRDGLPEVEMEFCGNSQLALTDP